MRSCADCGDPLTSTANSAYLCRPCRRERERVRQREWNRTHPYPRTDLRREYEKFYQRARRAFLRALTPRTCETDGCGRPIPYRGKQFCGPCAVFFRTRWRQAA